MSKLKYFLTIKDFIAMGVNFRTEVQSFSFAQNQSGSISLSGGKTLGEELSLVRKPDKYSHHFIRLSMVKESQLVKGIRSEDIVIPGAIVSINLYSWKGGLQKRTIFTLTEITDVRYISANSASSSEAQGLEMISLRCNEITMRDSSVEDAPFGESFRW